MIIKIKNKKIFWFGCLLVFVAILGIPSSVKVSIFFSIGLILILLTVIKSQFVFNKVNNLEAETTKEETTVPENKSEVFFDSKVKELEKTIIEKPKEKKNLFLEKLKNAKKNWQIEKPDNKIKPAVLTSEINIAKPDLEDEVVIVKKIIKPDSEKKIFSEPKEIFTKPIDKNKTEIINNNPNDIISDDFLRRISDN